MDQTGIEQLEKVTGQIEGLHREISALTKKSAIDPLNKFKLRFVNTALASANGILADEYRPFPDFDIFDPDDVPSNSDVALILAQYLEELERKRADNISYRQGRWVYIAEGEPTQIRTAPPKKISGKR